MEGSETDDLCTISFHPVVDTAKGFSLSRSRNDRSNSTDRKFDLLGYRDEMKFLLRRRNRFPVLANFSILEQKEMFF